jgi:hypothetical protein
MLVFDGEIKKAILRKGENQIPGIEYCEGWKDFVGMGISVIAVYDFIGMKYRVFLEDNLSELKKLIEDRAFVIGFNNESFDNKLLVAHGIDIPEEKSFDLLKAIREATGTFKGLGLGAICEANFTTSKNGDGAFAPILWQQKQYGKVIDYCLNDVNMTLNILNRIMEIGYLIDPRDEDNIITVDLPIDIKRMHTHATANIDFHNL